MLGIPFRQRIKKVSEIIIGGLAVVVWVSCGRTSYRGRYFRHDLRSVVALGSFAGSNRRDETWGREVVVVWEKLVASAQSKPTMTKLDYCSSIK